jgi:drug/metabolite transporter (DMT)-like permease
MTGESETRAGSAFLPEIILGAVILIWASTFVITKDALDDFTPFSFIFARFSIILVLALTVLGIQSVSRGWRQMWHIDRADLPRFLAAGIIGYTFYQTGFTVGIDHTTPFSSSLLIANVPLFTLVIASLLGERYPVGAWAGVVVAVVGVSIFLLDGGTAGTGWLGIAFSAGAAVSFAIYGIINRPLVRKYPPTTVSAYTTLFGTVPLLLVGIPDARAQDWGGLETSHWLMLLYMAIFPIYLVYIGYNWAIKQRGIIATSAGLVVPIVSGILSVIVFDEAFGPLKLAGALVVLVGLVLIQHTNLRIARNQRRQAQARRASDIEAAATTS